jgi:Tripartite tricarboxylate transporter family receptor
MSPVIATCRHRSNTSKLAKVRALAVTTARRAEALPDLPTVGEFVPGYEARSGNGPPTCPPNSVSGNEIQPPGKILQGDF